MRGTPWRGALLAGTVGLALVAGCAPGSRSTADQPSTKPAGAIQTNPAKMGDVRLVVWDQLVRGGQDAWMTELNAEFERKYPNIKIKRVSRSFEDLKTTLKLALSGDDPPDVVQANNARSDMGAFVSAGLLRPLDQYAKAYGWTERYPESVLSYSRYSPDGSTFGTGTLYGLPQEGEVVGIFYNKEKLAQLGIDPPKTWEEFEAALAAAKKAGEVPIQFGNLDQWPAIHLLGTVQGRYVPPETIRTLAFGRPGASWTGNGNLRAAQQLTQWADKGYLTPGFNGLGYDKSWQKFVDGEGVFKITGSWLLADLQKAMGDKLGFMLPPSPRGADGPIATGGTGLPFAITSKSEHPDAAAAYINFITNKKAMRKIAANGGLPVVDAAKQEASSAAQEDIFQTWQTASSQDGLVPYLDYATPTFYDTLTAETQNLLGGKTSPEGFLERLQKDYQEFTQGEG